MLIFVLSLNYILQKPCQTKKIILKFFMFFKLFIYMQISCQNYKNLHIE